MISKEVMKITSPQQLGTILHNWNRALTKEGHIVRKSLERGITDSETRGLIGLYIPRAIERLSLEGHHKQLVFNKYNFSGCEMRNAFSDGCPNKCLFCRVDNKPKIGCDPYCSALEKIKDSLDPIENGQRSIRFNWPTTDGLAYFNKETGANMADLLRFYSQCAAYFQVPTKKQTIYTAGYPLFSGNITERGAQTVEDIRALQNLDFLEARISFHLFKPQVLSRFNRHLRDGSEESFYNAVQIIKESENMYESMISGFEKANTKFVRINIRSQEGRPALFEGIQSLQDLVFDNLKRKFPGLNIEYGEIDWDSSEIATNSVRSQLQFEQKFEVKQEKVNPIVRRIQDSYHSLKEDTLRYIFLEKY